MRNREICTFALIAAGFVAWSGCDDNSMNKDLKRQADRATIKLNQTENERDALRDEVTKLKANTDGDRKRADAAMQEAEALRKKLSQTEAELLNARQQVRKLEEAALAARQGMPASRNSQP